MAYPVEPFARRHPRVIPYTVLISVGVLILAGLFWAVQIQQAKARDAERLSDMHYLARLFVDLKLQSNSYRPAASVNGCIEENVAVNQCDFSSLGIERLTLRGPNGDYYVVTQVPTDDSYEVAFELERSYYDLPSGVHTLSPKGIE